MKQSTLKKAQMILIAALILIVIFWFVSMGIYNMWAITENDLCEPFDFFKKCRQWGGLGPEPDIESETMIRPLCPPVNCSTINILSVTGIVLDLILLALTMFWMKSKK